MTTETIESVVAGFGVDAERAARAAIEKAKRETPRFPRWFALMFPSMWRGMPCLLVRHTDAGAREYFANGVWERCPCGAAECSLAGTEAAVGFMFREISRADAFLITGGNP